MDNISSKTYEEVYNVIKNYEEFREKLPKNIVMHIRKKALRHRL